MGPRHWIFRYKAAAQLKALIYSRDQGSTEQHIQMETDYGGGGGVGEEAPSTIQETWISWLVENQGPYPAAHPNTD